MFSFTDNRFTHMPFIAFDPDGKPKEFCCIMNDGQWKLYHFSGQKWERLGTGLPADATECSPTAEFDEGIWKVSFIAGGWESDRRFRLYRMYGLDAAPMAQGFADVGFVCKNRVAMATRRGPIVIIEPGRKRTLILQGVEFIYRLSYDPSNPNCLLISGGFTGGGIFSWAYQPGLKILRDLVADGNSAYKCALFGDSCHYAKREARFEERHIVKADVLLAQVKKSGEYIIEMEEFTGQPHMNMEFE